jgi:succinate dehydrogenase / fumarate reductase flavoprotein subunit
MSNIPGLFVIGEANYSDHGANRLGASALMQGLADGYFVVPYTIQNYLVQAKPEKVDVSRGEFNDDETRARDFYQSLIGNKGDGLVESFHHRLGNIMWDEVGMKRSSDGLQKALSQFPGLMRDFNDNVKVPGRADDLNEQLEKAARVADFIELGDLMARDALAREESCGAHFREEFQTQDHEARRNDEKFQHVAVWQHNDEGDPIRHIEPLKFVNVKPETRSYK